MSLLKTVEKFTKIPKDSTKWCPFQLHTCQHLEIRNQDIFITALTPPPSPRHIPRLEEDENRSKIDRALQTAPKSTRHAIVHMVQIDNETFYFFSIWRKKDQENMIYVFSLKVKNRDSWQGMQLSEQQFRKKTFLPCQLAEFHFWFSLNVHVHVPRNCRLSVLPVVCLFSSKSCAVDTGLLSSTYSDHLKQIRRNIGTL